MAVRKVTAGLWEVKPFKFIVLNLEIMLRNELMLCWSRNGINVPFRQYQRMVIKSKYISIVY